MEESRGAKPLEFRVETRVFGSTNQTVSGNRGHVQEKLKACPSQRCGVMPPGRDGLWQWPARQLRYRRQPGMMSLVMSCPSSSTASEYNSLEVHLAPELQ